MNLAKKPIVFSILLLFLFSQMPVQATYASTDSGQYVFVSDPETRLDDNSAQGALNYDFGDAPDPTYPTLLSSGGAAHLLGTDVYLGSCVDTEADGQPSATSVGDNSASGSPVYGTCTGSGDEDGVVFTSALIPGTTGAMDVTANSACMLSAWIDFNADGSWDDAGEEVYSGVSIAAGVNSLNFSIPASASTGNTFARFRCTTDGAVSYTGLANDGEVEDYQVAIVSPAPEIDVQRNNSSITAGSTNSIGNPGVGTIQLSYVIDNSAGTDMLAVDSISVSNLSNVSAYTPTSATTFTVPAGNHTVYNFSITIDAAGSFAFDITINSDDSDEGAYVIHVTGNAFDLSVLSAGTSPADGSILSASPDTIKVHFNKDVLADGSTGAANYIANYMLVEAGLNSVFDTNTCLAGVVHDDTNISIDLVNYDASSHTATLDINGGADLASGSYRLFVCGTTSVEDLFGFELNNGAADTPISFTLNVANVQSSQLPDTGFPQGRITKLPPVNPAYASTEMVLDIPEIDLSLPIIGVPKIDDQWDVSWLNQAVGYLNGTAFPTWMGNTVLTGHVWDANNQPGPFAEVHTLSYGDRFSIYAWGQVYTYEVRENKRIAVDDMNQVMQHEHFDWVTLLTCEGYDESTGTYPFRRMIRAVLVDIQ